MKGRDIQSTVDDAITAAMRRYDHCYDNGLYMIACEGDRRLGIWLQDAAMAICGHPRVSIDASDTIIGVTRSGVVDGEMMTWQKNVEITPNIEKFLAQFYQ